MSPQSKIMIEVQTIYSDGLSSVATDVVLLL